MKHLIFNLIYSSIYSNNNNIDINQNNNIMGFTLDVYNNINENNKNYIITGKKSNKNNY